MALSFLLVILVGRVTVAASVTSQVSAAWKHGGEPVRLVQVGSHTNETAALSYDSRSVDSVVSFGPGNCVSTWKNTASRCMIKTDCKDVDISKYNFQLICVDSGGAKTRHVFGRDSFESVETFDTLLVCNRCEADPSDIINGVNPARIAKTSANLKGLIGEVEDLKDEMFNASAAVRLLQQKVFQTNDGIMAGYDVSDLPVAESTQPPIANVALPTPVEVPVHRHLLHLRRRVAQHGKRHRRSPHRLPQHHHQQHRHHHHIQKALRGRHTETNSDEELNEPDVHSLTSVAEDSEHYRDTAHRGWRHRARRVASHLHQAADDQNGDAEATDHAEAADDQNGEAEAADHAEDTVDRGNADFSSRDDAPDSSQGDQAEELQHSPMAPMPSHPLSYLVDQNGLWVDGSDRESFASQQGDEDSDEYSSADSKDDGKRS